MTGRANPSPGEMPVVATWLGRLGLLPFLFLAAASVACGDHRVALERALAAYSFGILSFLLGAWWGLALIRRHSSALLLSNAVFLLVLFSYLGMATPAFLLTAAIAFVALLVIERRHPLFRLQPPYYARMRVQLSATAALALAISAAVSS